MGNPFASLLNSNCMQIFAASACMAKSALWMTDGKRRAEHCNTEF